jgi:outer membrane protein assembly factor BamB
MALKKSGGHNPESGQLRAWPGIGAAVLVVTGFIISAAFPAAAIVGMPAVLIGMLAVPIWWLFFSRRKWTERLAALALVIVAWIVLRPFLHFSILGGAMGALPVLAFSILFAALGAWAWATRNQRDGVRFALLIPALAVACVFCALVRTAGVGPGIFDFHWRWTPTPEDRLLALGNDDPAPIPSEPRPAPVEIVPTPATAPASSAAPLSSTPPDSGATWPGFRGKDRDGVVHNVRIETDWVQFPPVELWRKPIGPGWSSFAVDGDLIFTQEQRGDDEIVAAYRLSTGEPVWRHREAVRFYESNAGPGPRGTPTLSNGRVYAFGATGVLSALDAATGKPVWTRDVSADTAVAVPMWGFSSSPLVVGDIVVVAAEGRLVAYDIVTGREQWIGPAAGFSYSSPHLVTIDGVQQIVLLRGDGATSVLPSDGTVLWNHDWEGGSIAQPAMTADGNILINSITFTGGQGIRRLSIAHKDQWAATELWTSTALKPYFNDFVVNKGYAFGFDGSILSSIDLTDGKRKWKGGRYGSGQLVLIADQDLLLVLSDEGEVALVSATPAEFREIARFKAIEGKTWNHPVLVADTLLVRNGEEMAAFKLRVAGK